MAKLNQVVAAEKSVKARASKAVDDLYKAIQKGGLFQGISRTYRPKVDDGELLPSEHTKVQMTADGALREVVRRWEDLFDTVATKDFANTQAVADVVVDGTTVVHGAPVTYLLWLEKQVVDFHTFVSKLPTLDPAEEWDLDVNSGQGVWKSGLVTTLRTKKEPRVIELTKATPEHPAQATLVQEDVLEGYWDTVKFSGGMPQSRVQELQDRAMELLKAVKFAREEANAVDAAPISVGGQVFNYLLAN